MTYLEDGNILTDRRVISYEEQGGQLVMYSAALEDIVEIVVAERGDSFSDTVVEIYTSDGSGFMIFLSPENGGDDEFLVEVRRRTTMLEEAPYS